MKLARLVAKGVEAMRRPKHVSTAHEDVVVDHDPGVEPPMQTTRQRHAFEDDEVDACRAKFP